MPKTQEQLKIEARARYKAYYEANKEAVKARKREKYRADNPKKRKKVPLLRSDKEYDRMYYHIMKNEKAKRTKPTKALMDTIKSILEAQRGSQPQE